jgi:hypothetical protein
MQVKLISWITIFINFRVGKNIKVFNRKIQSKVTNMLIKNNVAIGRFFFAFYRGKNIIINNKTFLKGNC